MLSPASFFDLETFPEKDIFSNCIHVWDVLKQLKEYTSRRTRPEFSHRCLADGVPLLSPFIVHNGKLRNACECTIEFGDATKGQLKVKENGQPLEGASVIMAGAVLIGKQINIGKGVLIESGSYIQEPVIIGDHSVVRHGAYIRGHCIIGERCVVGHATELKHSIFLNDAKAGHFAYLGDSILGNNVNLGAGTKFANLRFFPGSVSIKGPEGLIDSGLRKIGAILGDNSQTGCNSVTNPGTIMAKDCALMPNTTAPSGYHPPSSLLR
ncbi:LbetaH domain-containing protein [Desulfogranum mediterraneum]|uniref:bifunctional GlmU protein n=1 Tax=Desulfogranum mediterraneum TaxID=160661 RepID=UPI0003F5DC77|nr:bifunctional GlmU protein [Desulfogranum mediterraneum]